MGCNDYIIKFRSTDLITANTEYNKEPRSGDLSVAIGISQGFQPRSLLFIAIGTSLGFQPRSGGLFIVYASSLRFQPRSGGLFVEIAYLLLFPSQCVIFPDRSYGALIVVDARNL